MGCGPRIDTMRFPIILTFIAVLWIGRAGGEQVAVIDSKDRVAIVGNTFADQMRRYGYVEAALRQVAPGIAVRNLGWAGDTVSVRARPTNFEREDESLARHRTDLILLCFGLGEALEGEDIVPAFVNDLAALIAHYRSQNYNGQSAPRIVLISPIATVDLGPRTPHHVRLRSALKAITGAMKQVAMERELPFVDLYTPTQGWTANDGMSDNGLHPNQKGYQVLAGVIAEALAPAYSVRIDAAQPTPSGAVSGVEAIGGGIEFGMMDSWTGYRRIVVKNLPPANYTLSVAGQRTLTATHEQWAKGVDVATSLSKDAEILVQRIVDKNDHFVYGWKALNTVHIVGERRKSKSGQSLPAEIKTFYQMVDERDGKLDSLHPSERTQLWRLVANPERRLR